MYLIYDDNGKITATSSHRPGDYFRFIHVTEVPERVEAEYYIVDGQLVKRAEALVQPYNYVFSRMGEYSIEHQLNLLVDDINAGLFGAKAKTGKFMTYINNIKSKYPKD